MFDAVTARTFDIGAARVFETEVFLEAECASDYAFEQIKAEKSVEAWCPEEDSNLHTLRHTDLNRARLPIPPSGHKIA